MHQRGEINDSRYDLSLFQIVLSKSERVAFVLQTLVDLFSEPGVVWVEALTVPLHPEGEGSTHLRFYFGQLLHGKLEDQLRGKRKKEKINKKERRGKLNCLWSVGCFFFFFLILPSQFSFLNRHRHLVLL